MISKESVKISDYSGSLNLGFPSPLASFETTFIQLGDEKLPKRIKNEKSEKILDPEEQEERKSLKGFISCMETEELTRLIDLDKSCIDSRFEEISSVKSNSNANWNQSQISTKMEVKMKKSIFRGK